MCLFIGILVLPIQAQDKANDASQRWDYGYAQAGVWCDGVMIDFLTGELRIHYVTRSFDNGLLKRREIDQFRGELTSTTTGEVFKFNRTITWEQGESREWTAVIHYNMKGNMGTMYSGKIFLDYNWGSPIFTEIHATCH